MRFTEKYVAFAGMFLFFALVNACTPDDDGGGSAASTGVDLSMLPFGPTLYEFELPDHFARMPQPADNEATIEGVKLGQALFFDPVLSRDSTISCASCHEPELAFTDGEALSVGIEGRRSLRSSMSLVNIGYQKSFFWDGRSGSLEDQSLHPVEDPNEMDAEWPNIELRLQNSSKYQRLFRAAFGIETSTEISKELAAKAMAQFERTIVSTTSRWDEAFQLNDFLSDLEFEGQQLFFTEPTTEHPGCSHCHNAPTFSDLSDENGFRNNGLDSAATLADFPDPGRGAVTGNAFDNGKFRAPSLRNIELTAPYMHDGRFQTLDEVLDHYSSGGHYSPSIDVQMTGFPLDSARRDALKAFLLTLTDLDALAREEVNDPN